MTIEGFEIGHTYNRRDGIHAKFGGQQQGGIITPSKQPLIFAITGASGRQHGYEDRWIDDGSFRYFGEGQVGDMRWERGNNAIRDHATDGRELLLFEVQKTGGLQFRRPLQLRRILLRTNAGPRGVTRGARSSFTSCLSPMMRVLVQRNSLLRLRPLRSTSLNCGAVLTRLRGQLARSRGRLLPLAITPEAARCVVTC